MYVEPEMAHYYLSILKEGRASSNVVIKDKRFLDFHNALYADLKRKIRARYQVDGAIADDVLSEVYIKIFTAKNYPSDPAMFFAWVSMICRNEYVNYYRKYIRKNKSHENFSEDINEEIDADNFIETDNLAGQNDEKIEKAKVKVGDADSSDSEEYKNYMVLPENVHTEEISDVVIDQVKKNDLVNCVKSAIRNLHAKSIDKALAIEWQMDGLSSQQIAQLLGRSDDATRRLLSDAKKMLRQFSVKCFEMIR